MRADSKKLTKNGIAFVAKSISRYVLTYGGLAFIIAGFGFGAFALIIYLVLAPSMPSIYWGFVPDDCDVSLVV